MREIKFECLDCGHVWLEYRESKSESATDCPLCAVHKMKVVRTKKEPKQKIGKPLKEIAEEKKGMPAYHNRNFKQAEKLVMEEAEKQGFTNMQDNMREGDVAAPPLQTLVSQVQDRFMGGGWNGNATMPVPAGVRGSDTGGAAAMKLLQSGSVPDMLNLPKRTPK